MPIVWALARSLISCNDAHASLLSVRRTCIAGNGSTRTPSRSSRRTRATTGAWTATLNRRRCSIARATTAKCRSSITGVWVCAQLCDECFGDEKYCTRMGLAETDISICVGLHLSPLFLFVQTAFVEYETLSFPWPPVPPLIACQRYPLVGVWGACTISSYIRWKNLSVTHTSQDMLSYSMSPFIP